MKEPFIVTIQLQQAAESLRVAFASSQAEMKDTFNAAIEDALKNFDLPRYLTQMAEQVIKQEAQKVVESYFRYGDGRKALEKVIHESLKDSAD